MEQLILKSLLTDELFARQTLPYIKKEYFSSPTERVLFEQIDGFINKYNTIPTNEAIIIELDNSGKVNDKEFKECCNYMEELSGIDANQDKAWILERTEKFCQEKALYNAIMESIGIIDGNNEKKDKGAIPEILSTALSVSFDPNVGHDFIENSDSRYDFYHRNERRIPFDIELLNKITQGGLPPKSLSVILAGTGLGKSMFMCHMAAANLLEGRNVLYISMEMSEERIAERIDANLLDCTMDELHDLSKEKYDRKIKKLKSKTHGKLIIKEYPTAQAHVGHFRHLLTELKMKKGFRPDIIFIDYLNICASSRMRMGGSINSYLLIKAIAEEIRGLAMEKDVPIISATQTNRCLALDTIVEKEGGEKIEIKDLIIGDKILSSGDSVRVENIFPIEKQKIYRVRTKSGKIIEASAKHIFPTASGLSSIETGLSVGTSLFVKDD